MKSMAYGSRKPSGDFAETFPQPRHHFPLAQMLRKYGPQEARARLQSAAIDAREPRHGHTNLAQGGGVCRDDPGAVGAGWKKSLTSE